MRQDATYAAALPLSMRNEKNRTVVRFLFPWKPETPPRTYAVRRDPGQAIPSLPRTRTRTRYVMATVHTLHTKHAMTNVLVLRGDCHVRCCHHTWRLVAARRNSPSRHQEASRGARGSRAQGRSNSVAPLEPSATGSPSFTRETWHVAAADLVVAKRFVPHLLSPSGAFHETPSWSPSLPRPVAAFHYEKKSRTFAAPC